jgi:hypothetical protein
MANGKRQKAKVNAPKLESPTPAFDVGFQLQPQNNLENQLGTAAIDTESNMEALSNRLDVHLSQMQTNTSMLQTTLQDQLHTALKQPELNVTLLQQNLEGNLAASMGRSIEQTAVIAPQDQFVQELRNQIQPGPTIPQPVAVSQPVTQAGIAAVAAVNPLLTAAFWANATCDQITQVVAAGGIQIRPGYQIQVTGPTIGTLSQQGIGPQVCRITLTEYVSTAVGIQTYQNYYEVPYTCCDSGGGGGGGGGGGAHRLRSSSSPLCCNGRRDCSSRLWPLAHTWRDRQCGGTLSE